MYSNIMVRSTDQVRQPDPTVVSRSGGCLSHAAHVPVAEDCSRIIFRSLRFRSVVLYRYKNLSFSLLLLPLPRRSFIHTVCGTGTGTGTVQ